MPVLSTRFQLIVTPQASAADESQIAASMKEIRLRRRRQAARPTKPSAAKARLLGSGTQSVGIPATRKPRPSLSSVGEP